MKIYAVHHYGQADPEDRESWGDLVVSYHTARFNAEVRARQEFLREPPMPSGKDPWYRSVVLWHESRDPEKRRNGRKYLWSCMPLAAPAMDDEDRSFYPQMRETSWHIDEIEVEEP